MKGFLPLKSILKQTILKNIFLTLLGLLVSTIIVAQDTLYFDSIWQQSTKENAHYYRIDKKEKKFWLRTDYFLENNQIQMQGHIANLSTGRKEGVFKWFYKSGKLRQEGEFRKGEAIGLHRSYYSNGELEAEQLFNKKGDLHGEYKAYHENGKILLETHFVNGYQTGYTKYFRDNGTIHSEGNFSNGDRDGEWKFYDEEGTFLGVDYFQVDHYISEAGFLLTLPNSEWYLDSKNEGERVSYVFKREAVRDDQERWIIPSIVVLVEDLKGTNSEKDVVVYSLQQQISFKESGVSIEEILAPNSEGFPLSSKNTLFIKSSYLLDGFEHSLYMIHSITKKGKGIQVYFDITKDLDQEFQDEIQRAIRLINL